MQKEAIPLELVPGRNDKCPCESSRKAKKCCLLAPGRFLKNPIRLETPGPKTNITNEGCLAAFTYDCSDKLSREHYFSKTILERIGSEFVISGFPWKSDDKPIKGTASFTTKYFCTRHNSMLSPLDQVAGNIFSAIRRFDKSLANDACAVSEYTLFHYLDFERWLIKTLLATYKAGLAIKDKMPIQMDPQLLDIYAKALFENQIPPEDGHGFYLAYEKEQAIRGSGSFSFVPMTATITDFSKGARLFSGVSALYSPLGDSIELTEKF
jgi:hypothetical protein